MRRPLKRRAACSSIQQPFESPISKVAILRLGVANDATLSPRLRQTLQSLLKGVSEKQVAQRLGLSQHTVHVYVKKLYRRYGVSSRGELLARWVAR
jgi:DNA-binding CsgD family transcriptional regulator